MKNKLIEQIAHDVTYHSYKCPYCERLVPNYAFLTEDKCQWCDIKYWLKKLDNDRKT